MKNSSDSPNPEPDSLNERDYGLDLELPVEPDFISQRTRYPLDKALEFVEEMRAMFPPPPDQAERRRKTKCDVEFIL